MSSGDGATSALRAVGVTPLCRKSASRSTGRRGCDLLRRGDVGWSRPSAGGREARQQRAETKGHTSFLFAVSSLGALGRGWAEGSGGSLSYLLSQALAWGLSLFSSHPPQTSRPLHSSSHGEGNSGKRPQAPLSLLRIQFTRRKLFPFQSGPCQCPGSAPPALCLRGNCWGLTHPRCLPQAWALVPCSARLHSASTLLVPPSGPGNL